MLLWVYGDRLRAEFENVVLAEYHCRYDWKEHRVKDVRNPVLYQTPFASPQQRLIPLNEQVCITAEYRPLTLCQRRCYNSEWQLVLFELVAA